MKKLLFFALLTGFIAMAEPWIQEITCVPVKDFPVAVELKNPREQTVDLSNWSLRDGQGRQWRIPAGTRLAPNQLLVVLFGTPPVGWNPSESAMILRAEPDDFLGEELLEECALFASSASAPEDLVDFVQWGYPVYQEEKAFSEAKQQALVQGVWHPDDFIVTVGVDPIRGQSIGRGPDNWKTASASDSGWLVYPPGEANIGKDNPPPRPDLSVWAWYIQGGARIQFFWAASCQPGCHFRLQVSSEPDFVSGIVADLAAVECYGEAWGIPVGHYFWRVRQESATMTGMWSPVYPVDVIYTQEQLDRASRPAPRGE